MKIVRVCILFLFIILNSLVYATHNRAGEILYTRIQPFTTSVAGYTVPVYTYSFTIILYTNDGPGIADRCQDTIYFGDGTRGIAPRINDDGSVNCSSCNFCGQIILSQPGYTVKKNIYTITHTYPGPGTFKVSTFDPNRNLDVQNIPNSVDQPFYVESMLQINAFTGAVSSPQFNFPPIDQACVGKCFYHNPGAYDPDGDSLSFEITTCRGVGGLTIPGFTQPNYGTSGTFSINPTKGTLSWCSPPMQGQYNMAFIVRKWRRNTSGVYENVGYVERDMQVVVNACPTNNPPFVAAPQDTCVEAGAFISKIFKVSDPDAAQTVTLQGGGGAFSVPPPYTAAISPTSGPSIGYNVNFSWQTNCNHIRFIPYSSTLKATDNGLPVSLVYFATYNIKVVPPAIQGLSVTPFGSAMTLTWQAAVCNPFGNPLLNYSIYRKNDCVPVTFSPCQSSMPPGFVKVGTVAANVTNFTDNNNGNGLVVGQNYSYVVEAVYTDSSQSYAGTSVCATLKKDIPIITNVDVLATDAALGVINVKWVKPFTNTGNFDTIQNPGPYTINLLYRSAGSGPYSLIYSNTQANFYQLPTAYTHSNINTTDTYKQYQIQFIASTGTVGSSQSATSVFLSATGANRKVNLSWQFNVPWTNTLYTIYRQAPSTSTYIAIGTTTTTSYVDSANIVNRYTYCYKVQSSGAYSDPGIPAPLINNSQTVCAKAIDMVPPCAPNVSLTANCPNGFVQVNWNNVSLICSNAKDVLKYTLYVKSTLTGQYIFVDTIFGASNTSYHFDYLPLVGGCYAVSAIDSSGNVSPLSTDVCIDNCPEFDLPNIVTMNGDGANDFFMPIRSRQIKEINLMVYDRWGNLVYTTNDPHFKWDGVSQISKLPVSEGTCFYVCEVFEPRVDGIKKRIIKSWLQIMR
ncbi:MAG: gliding motility-associated C-terminal domain-containing protein [Bacteroidetes bacterium]|nr:gliding motility-associated C-terminal domain-containing protein [Bacteroidota bacterium]